jgi:hypothetical protein
MLDAWRSEISDAARSSVVGAAAGRDTNPNTSHHAEI